MLNHTVNYINMFYFAILGGSLKKMAKKITISVPVNKNTYTKASIMTPYL